ncbi:MAG: putative Ig domain-containing protein, partial [Thermoanaerobaculia bacterium]
MNRLHPALIAAALLAALAFPLTQADAACPTILVGPTSLPDGVANTAYSQSLTQTGAASPTFSITAGVLPTGLSIDAAGNITGTPTAAGAFIFTGTASDASGCTGGRSYRVSVTCPSITVNPATAPNGQVGVPYATQTLVGSGGAAPYTFAVTAGALPAGLSQSGAGGATISGTPTTAGPFSFTITATDANNCTGTRVYSGTIANCPTIIVTPPATGQGFIGTAFSQQFTQSGAGTPTFTIDPTSPNTLPAGWSLAPSTGILSSASPSGGTFTIKVRVTDAGGCFGISGNYVVTISPSIASETYTPVVIGNMSIDTATGTTFSVLTNDTPGSTATLVSATSANGGNVTLNSATGTFTYDPPRGYEGTDSFQYTVTNGGQTSGPATVSLTVGGMVWFVDNTAGACAATCGRRTTPYATLAAFQAANLTGAALDPKAGDRIFIYQSAAPYTGPAAASVVLRNTQRLLGQDDTVTFNVATAYTVPDTTVAVPAMTPGAPFTTIQTVASQDAVTLAQDDVVRGLTIDAANNAAIVAGAVNIGTLGSIDGVTLTSSGSGGGISLGAHTGTLNVANSTIGGSGSGIAMSINGASAGSAAFTNTIVNKTAGSLLAVQNRTGSGSVTFTGGSLTLTGGGTGITLATNSATTTIALTPGFSLTTTTGRGLVTNAPGVLTIGGVASTINATGGAALDLTATNLAAGVTFVSITASTNTANGINLNNLSGTLTIGTTSVTLAAGATQGINVAGSSANITFASGAGTTQVNGAGGTQRILVGTSTGAIAFGNTTLDGGTDAVSLQNNSAGSRTFGTLTIGGTTPPSSAGFLHGAGGGATTVAGTTVITAGGNGIDINGNATGVTFSAGVTVNVTTGAGINVQGNTNLVASNVGFNSTLTISKSGAGSGVTIGTTATNGATSTVNLGVLSVTTSNGTGLLAGSAGTSTPLKTTAGGVINATGGPAINATSTNFNNGLFGNVTSNASTTQGITLTSCTGTLTMSGAGGALTLTAAAPGPAFSVSGGTVATTYSGTVTVTNGQPGVVTSNVAGGSLTLGTVNVSNSGAATTNDAISIDGINNVANPFAVSVTSATLNTTNMRHGVALGDLPAGSAVTISGGTITTPGATHRLVSFANPTNGTYTFSGVTFNGSTSDGLLFGANELGSYLFGATTLSTPNGGVGVTISSSPAAVTMSSLNQAGGTTALSVTTSTGAIAINGGAVSALTASDLLISGGANAITFAPSITNNGARSVQISGRTGGTVTVSGNITDTAGSTGISVTGAT